MMKKQVTYDIGYYHYPTCTVVANKAVEEKGDYQRLATMSHNGRKVNWEKKGVPANVVAKVEAYAKSLHTPNPSITLTIGQISDALSANFYIDREAYAVLVEAQKRDYVVILSATQAQWTDEGLAKARKELAANVPTQVGLALPGDASLIGAKVRYTNPDAIRHGTKALTEIYEVVGFQLAYAPDEQGEQVLIPAMRVVATSYKDTFGRPMHYKESQFVSVNN